MFPRSLERQHTKVEWQALPRSGGDKNYLEYIYKHPRFMVTCVYAANEFFIVSHLSHYFALPSVSSPAIRDGPLVLRSSLVNVDISASSTEHPVLTLSRSTTRT